VSEAEQALQDLRYCDPAGSRGSKDTVWDGFTGVHSYSVSTAAM